jgi:Domain of unknown function (DUF4382)
MQHIMSRRALYRALLTGLIAGLAACGGGGSGMNTSTTQSQTSVNMPLVISDASSDDWATVGVRVLSIALVPQGGGSAVTVWTAPAPAPYVNLEQLDQIGEILGNVSVPIGTYTAVILTISANPGDVLLTTAPDPEPGFPVAGGTSIPSDEINIQNAQGGSGSRTVPVTVNLVSPLSVSTSQSDALDLEFDLAHPAFIVGHTPPTGDGATLWAVNFSGPVRHHPIHDLTRLVLRHTYGTVTGVTTGTGGVPAGLLTITKDFPVLPPTNPETEITSTQSLNISADTVNGTIVYDLDSSTPGTGTVVNSFAGGTVPANDYVRIAARYQEDGTLVAVRVYYSSSFNKVWLSPEGHVLAVDANSDTIWVTNELGGRVAVSVTPSTAVYLHSGTKSIGAATTLLANQQIVRGFKVGVMAADPLNVPLVATSIDIETAAYGGAISNASTTLPAPNGGLTYTASFRTSGDYSVNLGFISDTANDNTDPEGSTITGFDWWDFTFPTTSSTNLTNFVESVNGQVNFGGGVGALTTYGVSAADWGDGGTVNISNWYLRDAVLLPAPVPLGTVTIAYTGGPTFAMTALGGAQAATVDVSTTTGSATLVYQMNRAIGAVTLTPVDITTPGGLMDLEEALTVGAPVKVYGIPQADGTLAAYVLVYYTGMMPAS